MCILRCRNSQNWHKNRVFLRILFYPANTGIEYRYCCGNQMRKCHCANAIAQMPMPMPMPMPTAPEFRVDGNAQFHFFWPQNCVNVLAIVFPALLLCTKKTTAESAVSRQKTDEIDHDVSNANANVNQIGQRCQFANMHNETKRNSVVFPFSFFQTS